MFLGNAIRRPQPLFDLASSVAAMKARVAGIPVYTVANKADEFILVTGGEVQSISICRPIMLSATTCKTFTVDCTDRRRQEAAGIVFLLRV